MNFTNIGQIYFSNIQLYTKYLTKVEWVVCLMVRGHTHTHIHPDTHTGIHTHTHMHTEIYTGTSFKMVALFFIVALCLYNV